MTDAQTYAKHIFEVTDNDGSKSRGFLDLLLLRIHEYPSLMSYLIRTNIRADGKIELEFNALPQEILANVQRLFNAQSKLFTYRKGVNARMVFEITPQDAAPAA